VEKGRKTVEIGLKTTALNPRRRRSGPLPLSPLAAIDARLSPASSRSKAEARKRAQEGENGGKMQKCSENALFSRFLQTLRAVLTAFCSLPRFHFNKIVLFDHEAIIEACQRGKWRRFAVFAPLETCLPQEALGLRPRPWLSPARREVLLETRKFEAPICFHDCPNALLTTGLIDWWWWESLRWSGRVFGRGREEESMEVEKGAREVKGE